MEMIDTLAALEAECERLAERGVQSAPEMLRLTRSLQKDAQSLLREREELASLYAVAHELAQANDLASLLESIMDKAIALVKGERGFVVLGEDGEHYQIATARRFDATDIRPDNGLYSTTLIRRVMETREPILTTNVQADERFELSQSIVLQDIRSVLAVPLVARGELQGAVYVDTRMSVRNFTEADLRLFEAMASQAAMAIRAARLTETLRENNARLEQALRELRETQEQLIQAERLAAVGRLAASVAHELRTPLMVMRSGLYFLDRLVAEGRFDSPETFRRYIQKVDAEIDRQSKIINDLLFFSRNRPRRLVSVDVNALVKEAVMRVTMPESVRVEYDLAPDLSPILADGDQIQQVLINLITNAVQAMPEGGTLTLRTAVEEHFAVVQVQDTGVGMTAEQMAHLFQPFYTTREQGIGLGLAVSRSIVEGHRGTISVESEPGKGTTFTVRLPYELIG